MPRRRAPARYRPIAAVLAAAMVALAGHGALARSARSAIDGRSGPRQQPTSATIPPRTATSTPSPAPTVARPDLAVTGMTVANARHDAQSLALTATFAVSLTNIGATRSVAPITATWFADVNGSRRFEPGADTILARDVWPQDVLPYRSAGVAARGGGRLPFRDAPVLVDVRDSGLLGEGNVVNNVGTTAGVCRRAAPGATAPSRWATPMAKWRWPRPGTTPPAPTKRQVEAAPAIVDLDGDDAAEVVFVTLDRNATGDAEGILRAVDGRTGADRFAVLDPESRVGAFSAPAVGDLLGDGPPEIVAVDAAYERVLAFDIHGTLVWRSDPVLTEPNVSRLRLAGPSLADFDGDGWPEILVDNVLLDAAGRLLGRVPPGAIAVDLDLVGLSGDEGPPRPEIVGFGFALKAHVEDRWLEPLWQVEGAAKRVGFNAVANLDDDPYPEVVVVGDNGDVQLLQHNGEQIKPSFCFAKSIECRQSLGGQGGPPVIADFNGDGRADIGVAGLKHFAALSGTGDLLWLLNTLDDNSGTTSAAAFDFDGDGASEIVYADRLVLRLIDGRRGGVLWQTSRPSLTTFEMPVVADVDGDASADLVVGVGGTDANGNMSADAGLAVWDNPAWAPARPVWNEHAFAHAFVDDAGRIPHFAPPTWQLRNGFRDAGLPGAPSFGQPDLTVGRLVRDGAAPPAAPRVLARIGNAGSAAAGRGVEVAFHRTSVTGTLLATATLSKPLAAGAFVDVAVDVPPDADAIAVVIDPLGRVAECAGGWHAVGSIVDAKANNVHAARLSTLPLAPPTPTPSTTPTGSATPTIGPTRSATIVLPWERTSTPTPTGSASATPTADGTVPISMTTTSTSTASATPSATPSSAPTTPSPTAARTPAQLWLPVAIVGRCGPGNGTVDAVLVIDTSAHMAELDGGWQRFLAVKGAAIHVLAKLAEGVGDRAAVVTAGDVAALRSTFADPTPMSALVGNLATERATSLVTPIDQALALARAEVGRARPEAAKLIVVISDGRAWPAQTAAAAAEARAAEAAGAVVVALGIGDTAAPVLPPLVAIAGSRARVRVPADAMDGEAAAVWAVGAARCPPGPLWAGR